MTTAYINRIATVVPPNDIHQAFHGFATSRFANDREKLVLFRRMAKRAGIEHRFSFLSEDDLLPQGTNSGSPFYRTGGFPNIDRRMERYEQDAPALAARAVSQLALDDGKGPITHLLITSCTGFSAPGIDLALVDRFGLDRSVERTVIGFMGCYAAINALKLAHHIVRSEPKARVLAVNVELCTLHLQDSDDLEQALLFLLFSDGCAASLISAEPVGIAIDDFRATVIPDTQELMSWSIRDFGFDMVLSGRVPAALQNTLPPMSEEILGGRAPATIDHWAVHPGGRTVLDAVERAFRLPSTALAHSREILRRFGNMSSPTVMFVLQQILQAREGGAGCAMAFGPGLTMESMTFRTAG